MKTRSAWLMIIPLLLFMASCAPSAKPGVQSGEMQKRDKFWSSETCRNCHGGIYRQYEESMHGKAFTNPVFQAQYFGELLPKADDNPELAADAVTCTRCHSYASYARIGRYITGDDRLDLSETGVTCDVCHAIKSYIGDEPGDGQFAVEPRDDIKLGPLRSDTDWHRAYSELHTRSEFCGVCHNDTNRYGLEVKSTYTEWKESKYAMDGIQCQDCHMTVVGFLRYGKSVYGEGKAAMAGIFRAPERKKLYTHRFPGAHSNRQVEGALQLKIEMSSTSPPMPGDEVGISVLVDNSRTGHKMPSGSADLRLLWLEVKAYDGGKDIAVELAEDAEHRSVYGVSGGGPLDGEMLGKSFPEGRRIYRAIYVDEWERQTHSFYEARKIVFDNRLEAGEVRPEHYIIRIPEGISGKIYISATLNYLPYSGPFAMGLGLPPSEVIEVAWDHMELKLGR